MKVVIQRVNEASVEVDKKEVGKINKGLLVLVGFTHDDTIENIEYIVKKMTNLRIFEDENGIMNISVKDIQGSILSVSQFTLYADTKKGNRPSYVNALEPTRAEELYNIFNQKLKEEGFHVETGIFGADMKVSLVNDGPVTIIIEK